jgi:hypothetical protein
MLLSLFDPGLYPHWKNRRSFTSSGFCLKGGDTFIDYWRVQHDNRRNIVNEENSRDEQMADFRYSVVAVLANPYLHVAAKRRQLIREKAERIWEIPGIGGKRLSEGCGSTIRWHWCCV